MSFCANCGSRLEEGTQFCGSCGAPVESTSQGQNQSNMAQQPINNPQRPNPAPQQQSQPPYQQQYQQPYQQQYQQPYQQPVYQQPYNAAPSQVGIYFAQVLDTVKNVLLRPISSISRVGRAMSDQAVFILGGLLAVIYALLNLWLFSAMKTNLKNSNIKDFGISQAYTGLMGEFDAAFKYPSKILFSMLLYILIILLIFASVFVLGKAIFKSQANTFSIFKVVVAASLPFVTFTLLQILLTYLSIGIGLLFGIFGLLISLLTLYKGLEHELQLDGDKTLLVLAISLIVTLFISVLIVNAITNSSLKAAFNVKNPNLNDILKGLPGF